jgi:hypothetical protein
MSNLIPGVLNRARNAFRRVGIQPPYWMIKLGRRLHGKYNRISDPLAPLASFAAHDRQHTGQLEAKVDHIIWTIERMEATLYLQSLQAAIQPVPPQPKPPAAGPAVVDASPQP